MKRDNYFYYVNVLLLFIVLLGFAPSFYLRPLSEAKPLPFYLIVHGLSCTGWFVIIVIQSYLIRKKKVVRHSKLGNYFSLIAPILVASGYLVLFYSIKLYHNQFTPVASGMEIPEQQSFTSLIITGDAIQLIIFSVFVFLGYKYRFKPEIHKRAMTIASIIICQQALVRIGKMDMLMIGDKPGASGGIYATLIPLLILLSILVYDKMKLTKVHRMTIVGLLSYLLFVASALALNITGVALRTIEMMR